MFNLNSHDALLSNNNILSSQIETMSQAITLVERLSKRCDFYEQDHTSGACRGVALHIQEVALTTPKNILF